MYKLYYSRPRLRQGVDFITVLPQKCSHAGKGLNVFCACASSCSKNINVQRMGRVEWKMLFINFYFHWLFNIEIILHRRRKGRMTTQWRTGIVYIQYFVYNCVHNENNRKYILMSWSLVCDSVKRTTVSRTGSSLLTSHQICLSRLILLFAAVQCSKRLM